MWQSALLVSPTTTLSRDVAPIGDDIEPVGESRADVDTGNEEEESLELKNPTLEEIQKNPTSRERENSKIVDMMFTGVGVLLVSKIVVQGSIFNMNHWRKKDENEQSDHGFLLIASHRRLTRMQAQHWNTRMNQVQRYFKKRRFTHVLRWL